MPRERRFDIEVTLSATGGARSVTTFTTVTIRGGSTSSDEITMVPDGYGPVTVSVVSATLQLKPDQTAKGILVRAGDPLTLTEGEGENTPATGVPSITGTVQVGEALTADTSGMTDADGLSNVQYEYQWMAADAEIAGATGLTYTLVAEDEGKAIKVRVSFTDDAGNEEQLTSKATGAVVARPNNPATGAPTINGTAQVGETLTADTSGISDEDGVTNPSFEYQWISDDGTTDVDIAGATSETYVIKPWVVGTFIKVRVSFDDDADNPETRTSAATSAVEPVPNIAPTGFLIIGGIPEVGQELWSSTYSIIDGNGLRYASSVTSGSAAMELPTLTSLTGVPPLIGSRMLMKARPSR